MEPGVPQYIGTPNAEIDAAWRDLLNGELALLVAVFR